MQAQRLAACGIVLLAGIVGAAERPPQSLTQADALRRLVDLERLTGPPDPAESLGVISSRERQERRGPDAPDSARFVRADDGWDVLAELAGPGLVARIAFERPDGELRIRIDGHEVFSATTAALFDGSVAPFAAPLCWSVAEIGAECRLPMPFARSCQVASRGCTSHFVIEHVALPPGARVEPFRRELSADARAALESASAIWKRGFEPGELFAGHKVSPEGGEEQIGRGASFTWTLEGASVIRELLLTCTEPAAVRLPYTLRHCVLRIWWDGETEPAVEAPVPDFFASGFDRRPVHALPAGTNLRTELPMVARRLEDQRLMYCRFPMPFRRGARLEIANLSDRGIPLLLLLGVERAAPPPDSLRFYARFRREMPCRGREFLLLDAAGPGRLVGYSLAIDTPAETEVRDVLRVGIDASEPFRDGLGYTHWPAGAWRWPLTGTTRAAPAGKSAWYRWRLADDIPFQKAARWSYQVPAADSAADLYVSGVAFWYGPPGGAPRSPRLVADDLAPPGLRIPHAVEIEGHVRTRGWGSEVKQKNAGGVEYSGEAAAAINVTRPVDVALPRAAAGDVDLSIRLDPAAPVETVEITAPDGQTTWKIGTPRSADGVYKLGRVSLKAGDNLFKVRCARRAILDCWIAAPASP